MEKQTIFMAQNISKAFGPAQSVIPTILGYGVVYSFLSGILDFTIGLRVIFASLVGGICARYFGITGLVIGCLTTSIILGLLTGLINNLLKITPVMLTLGLAMLYEVAAYKLRYIADFTYLDPIHTLLGRPYVELIFFIFTAILFYFLFYRLKVTYHIMAVGSNPILSKNVGVNLNLSKLVGFIIGGIFLGIASLLQVSYSGTVTTPTSLGSAILLFKPLMGVLVGIVLTVWCNMVIGIFIGTLSVNIIFIGLLASGIPDAFQEVALGFFMLLIMYFSSKRVEIIDTIRKLSERKKELYERVL